MVQPIDRLEVVVIVDNVTDSLSSTPKFVETEVRANYRRGIRMLSGACLCCAAHGLSCLLTAYRGGKSHSLLFDTGPEEDVFARNVARLGVDLGAVEAIVLSHGHWDHAGAMLRALDLITLGNGGRSVPTYLHPGMFGTRGVKLADGSMRPMEDVPSLHALDSRGAETVCTTEPQSVLEESFFVSGEIPRVTPFEQGLPGHFRRDSDGADWEPDPLLVDERFVAVDVAGKGVVVFTACSHAGVVNVLRHARDSFPGRPLFGVLGGFHLVGSNEKIIPQTVEALKALEVQMVAPAHCTSSAVSYTHLTLPTTERV